jgi:acyl carrier protein
MDDESLAAVLDGKVNGAAALHDLLGDQELDAFVVFSSIAGVWGSGGQAGYAAANAYLDALVRKRRGMGLAGTALAWGPWAGGGMLTDETDQALRRRGLTAMDPQLAVAVLVDAVGRRDECVAVADVDWSRLGMALTAIRPNPLLSALPELETVTEPGTDEEANTLRESLASTPPADRRRIMLGVVRTRTAAVLGHPTVDAIEPAQAFKELGFDSLTAVELRNGLSAATGLALSASLVFDHPTPIALAEHLLALLDTDEGADLDAALDSLEPLATALLDLPEDDTGRVRAVLRLQTLLYRLGGDRTEGRGEAGLDTATDDELFDLVDRDLGLS